MRRAAAGIAFALAAVLLPACGSSTSGPHLSNREQTMSACGSLQARIEGIGQEAGIRDPQPATLRGDTTAARLRPATTQALSALAESARRLGQLHAPRRVTRKISEGVEGYDAFARRLAETRSRSESENLKLETSFTLIGLRAAVGCLHVARQRGSSSEAE